LARIWIVTKDPGGHNAVWPVREELTRRGHTVLDIAHGKAIEILQTNNIPHIVVPDEDGVILTNWVDLPDILLTSTCSDGGLGRNLIPQLMEVGIPTVAVTDYWGGAQNQCFSDPSFWPSAICVQDELSKKILLDDWQEYEEDRVRITGQPSFDNLSSMNVEAVKSAVRQRSNCKEAWPIVVYAGQLQGSTHTLQALVKSLNVLPQPVYLALLKHPRFLINSPEEEVPWDEAVAQFTNGEMLESGKFTTETWSATCDVMVSMTSTVLAIAGYLRKECISILLPEIDKLQGLGLAGLPMEQLGTCAVARSQRDIQRLVTQALYTQGLGLRENQEKHFILDGGSAARVADIVEELMGG
jgi:hypothetical protein